MKKTLHYLSFLTLLCCAASTFAQNVKLERTIMFTDSVTAGGVKTAASTDDVEQLNNRIDKLYDDDLDAGWEGDPTDLNVLTVGLRFRNIVIPKGVRIDSAFLVLTSHEGKSKDDIANLTLYGDNVDNSPTFTADSLVTSRARTSASVRWIVAEEWKLWSVYRSPDLKSVIQEIVNRSGWQSGNALSLFMIGENQGPSEVENAREFEAYENIADPSDGGDGQNHPERRPRLVIYFAGTTSVESFLLPEAKPLKVFPNPAMNGKVTVELESDAAATIHLYDTKGQLLKTQRSDFGKKLEFNTDNLPSGTYFLQATQGTDLYIQKIMIDK